jgi:2-keto-4-pentenoate hydratase/2-oxohepta-3-ene-1,7-dioic acid hydratase in catechol pathway
VNALIASADRMTRYVTLHPGDVIWLGIDGATEPALKPGDVIEIEDGRSACWATPSPSGALN